MQATTPFERAVEWKLGKIRALRKEEKKEEKKTDESNVGKKIKVDPLEKLGRARSLPNFLEASLAPSGRPTTFSFSVHCYYAYFYRVTFA